MDSIIEVKSPRMAGCAVMWGDKTIELLNRAGDNSLSLEHCIYLAARKAGHWALMATGYYELPIE